MATQKPSGQAIPRSSIKEFQKNMEKAFFYLLLCGVAYILEIVLSLDTHSSLLNYKLTIMTIYEVIRQAILNKRSITCVYNGYQRHMSPHSLGRKDGQGKALFIQYAGGSSTGLGQPEDNWRCIFLDKLTNVSQNDDDFITAANHSRPQTCIDFIDVEVSF